MRLDFRAASSIAAALPSCRVALLLGGVLLLSESVVLATTFFAGACGSFLASLLIAAKVYRERAPRRSDPTDTAAASGAATP
jgi:hypothetical protein